MQTSNDMSVVRRKSVHFVPSKFAIPLLAGLVFLLAGAANARAQGWYLESSGYLETTNAVTDSDDYFDWTIDSASSASVSFDPEDTTMSLSVTDVNSVSLEPISTVNGVTKSEDSFFDVTANVAWGWDGAPGTSPNTYLTFEASIEGTLWNYGNWYPGGHSYTFDEWGTAFLANGLLDEPYGDLDADTEGSVTLDNYIWTQDGDWVTGYDLDDTSTAYYREDQNSITYSISFEGPYLAGAGAGDIVVYSQIGSEVSVTEGASNGYDQTGSAYSEADIDSGSVYISLFP